MSNHRINRDLYWDFWKGCAIISVVIIHALFSTRDFQPGTFNNNFGLYFRQLLMFAVPIFFGIAGYFSINPNQKFSSRDFLKSRTKRLLPPYLVWTLIYTAVQQGPEALNLHLLIKKLALGTGIGIGYFVIALFQWILITPLLLKIKRLKTGILISIALTILSTIFYYHFSFVDAESFFSSFPGNALPFFAWSPFYLVGFLVKKFDCRAITNKQYLRVALFAYLTFLILSIIEAHTLNAYGLQSLATSQLKLTSKLMSLNLLILILSKKLPGADQLSGKATLICTLGQRSYSVYLTHMIFMPTTIILLSKFPEIYQLQPLFVALTATIVIGLSITLDRSFKALLPKNNFALIFG